MKKNAAQDLLAALQSQAVSSVVPEGFYTKRQLADSVGVSLDSMTDKLLKMKVEMKMFRVTSGTVTRPIPHYRLVT